MIVISVIQGYRLEGVQASDPEAVPATHVIGGPFVIHKNWKERISAFWDFLVLFSGVSTASNLTRARGRIVLSRGLFLFRKR